MSGMRTRKPIFSRRAMKLIMLFVTGAIVWFLFPSSDLDVQRGPGDAETSQIPPQSVVCETTKGLITFHLNQDNDAPRKSIERLKSMVNAGFYDKNVAFFRVNDVMTQFGAVEDSIHKRLAEAGLKGEWERDVNPHGWKQFPSDEAAAKEEAAKYPWVRGDLGLIGGTQAVLVKKSGTTMGINDLDTVVARVSEKDMKNVVDKLYQYNDIIDNPANGAGPEQGRIYLEGIQYLKKEFPKVDYFIRCQLN